jgi:hypothetical protein
MIHPTLVVVTLVLLALVVFVGDVAITLSFYVCSTRENTGMVHEACEIGGIRLCKEKE